MPTWIAASRKCAVPKGSAAFYDPSLESGLPRIIAIKTMIFLLYIRRSQVLQPQPKAAADGIWRARRYKDGHPNHWEISIELGLTQKIMTRKRF